MPICPSCQSEDCRRSRRRGVFDIFRKLAGSKPWRCQRCQRRFFVWHSPISVTAYANCPRCGNTEIQRVSRDRVVGSMSLIGRLLRLPAYRCDPCRQRFFSIRPRRKIQHVAHDAAAD